MHVAGAPDKGQEAAGRQPQGHFSPAEGPLRLWPIEGVLAGNDKAMLEADWLSVDIEVAVFLVSGDERLPVPVIQNSCIY